MTKRATFEGRTKVDAWDQEQLANYAREYGGALSRYFNRRGAPPAVNEDLVQEVFARLAGLSRKGAIDNGEAYLMRTASTVWIDYLRKEQRANRLAHIEYEEELHSPAGFSADRVLESRQNLENVIRALESLQPRTRQIYLLCRVDGLKRREVARQVGISISAVDKHLMSAAKSIGLAVNDEE